jgi:hypothetical protein
MKPSELRTADASQDQLVLPYRRSDIAEPAITPDEARAPETAICRWHNGHIGHTRVSSDAEGKVYFCPMGRMYWRLNKRMSDFLKPLTYP